MAIIASDTIIINLIACSMWNRLILKLYFMKKKILSNQLTIIYFLSPVKTCNVYLNENDNYVVVCRLDCNKEIECIKYHLPYNIKEAIKFLQSIIDVEKEIIDFLKNF